MIVRQFLQWMQNAPALERAEATRDLAQSYLWGELSPSDQDAAEATLVSLLDDRSPLVRKALAETLAHAENAPQSVIAMLALDQSEIAEIVVKHSPVFIDSELIELARISSPSVQYALVTREDVSPALAFSLAEHVSKEVAEHLLNLEGIEEHDNVTQSLITRFGDDAAMRSKISDNLNLGASDKHALIQNLTSDLSAFMAQTGWLTPERTQKVMREGTDKSILSMALGLDADKLYQFIAKLLSKQEITANLLLRSLFCGNRAFFEVAMAQLSSLDMSRVRGLINDLSGKGLLALLDKAQIPESLYVAFEAILSPRFGSFMLFNPKAQENLHKAVIDSTIKIYASTGASAIDSSVMLLRRFASEAAREEARHFTSDLMVEAEVTQTLPLDATIGWDVEQEAVVQPVEAVVETPLTALDMFKLELEAASKPVENILHESPLADQDLTSYFNENLSAQNDEIIREKQLEDQVFDMIVNGYRKAA